MSYSHRRVMKLWLCVTGHGHPQCYNSPDFRRIERIHEDAVSFKLIRIRRAFKCFIYENCLSVSGGDENPNIQDSYKYLAVFHQGSWKIVDGVDERRGAREDISGKLAM